MKLSKDRYQVIFFCAVALAVIIFCLRSYSTEAGIERRGVFAIGKITEAREGRKGAQIKAWFRYKNRVHFIGASGSFTFHVRPGKRIVVQFLPGKSRKIYCYKKQGSAVLHG